MERENGTRLSNIDKRYSDLINQDNAEDILSKAGGIDIMDISSESYDNTENK